MCTSDIHANDDSFCLSNDENAAFGRISRDQGNYEDDDSITLQKVEVLGSGGDEDEEDLVHVFHRMRTRTDLSSERNSITLMTKRSNTVPETSIDREYFNGFIGANVSHMFSSDTIVADNTDKQLQSIRMFPGVKEDITSNKFNDAPISSTKDFEVKHDSDDSITILGKGDYENDCSHPVKERFTDENDDDNYNTNDDDDERAPDSIQETDNNEEPKPSEINTIHEITITTYKRIEEEQRSPSTREIESTPNSKAVPQMSTKPRTSKRRSTLIELCAKTNPVPYRVGLSKRANVSHLHDYLLK